MGRSLRVRWVRIIIWVVAIVVISVGLYALDIALLQKHPILLLSNYSDVVLTIWQTQTTIASLTLASAAFILGKIDNSYYGISIKNLLHLSRNFPKIELSFWEKIICSIVLPAVTGFFVILDNITATGFLLLLTVCFSTAILVECINVITKSEIYSDWAREIVNKLVDTITASAKQDGKGKNAAKQQLNDVIRGIEAEVSSEIRCGLDLRESETYWYLVRLMASYSTGDMAQLNEQMHATLIEWLTLAINIKSEQNIRTVLWASYPEDLHSRWGATGINVFMCSYYHGDISTQCFQSEIDRIKRDVLQACNDYTAKALFVLRNAIDYADVETFSQIIKAVWRSKPYTNHQMKSNVLITAVAYLYYVAFKEQYMPIEKGRNYLENLRAFSDATILESYRCSKPQTIKELLSDVDLIFGGAEFLLHFFDDRNFNWEYVSLGEVKTARLGRDTIEFLTFYCYLYFKHIRVENFSQLNLDVLLKMKSYINVDGIIDEKHADKYAAFCTWLGKDKEAKQQNECFYSSLIAAIKDKMVSEAKDLRERRDVWTNKICNMKNEISNYLLKSALYMDLESTRESFINLNFCEFYLLNDFSECNTLYGNEQVIRSNIESKIFDQMYRHSMLDCHDFGKVFDNPEDSITSLQEVIQQMKEMNININKTYNFSFYNGFSYRRLSESTVSKIQLLNATIQSAGQWDTGYMNVAIYIDSNLETVGFCFNYQSFMTVAEQLSETELKYVCQKYKTDDGFLFKETDNSVGIPFSEEELMEYLRVAMIKIRYSFLVKLPRKKMGFAITFTG